MMTRNKKTLIVIILIIILGAGGAYYFLVYKKAAVNTNVNNANVSNLNVNANASITNKPKELPKNHAITDEERKQLGYSDKLEGEIRYAYDKDGNVVSYFDIAKDNRPKDTDGDGLSDEDEVKYKTDPKNPDSDGDTLGDGNEIQGVGADLIKTDPAKKDTDEDGLDDWEEFAFYKTNPLKKDTDADGFTDKEELDKGYNPLGSGKITDPDLLEILKTLKK